MAKVLQIIRTQPLAVAAIVILLLLVAIAQRPEKRVYQWEVESQQLERQINQFSDLAQPRKR